VSSTTLSLYGIKRPRLITTVHTNGTITVQCGNKIDRINIWRVKPFEADLDNE
jgi:hypothetical protein